MSIKRIGVVALIYAFDKLVKQGQQSRDTSCTVSACKYDLNNDGSVRCVIGWLMNDEELARYSKCGSWLGSLFGDMDTYGQHYLAGFEIGCESLGVAQQIHDIDGSNIGNPKIYVDKLIHKLQYEGYLTNHNMYYAKWLEKSVYSYLEMLNSNG